MTFSIEHAKITFISLYFVVDLVTILVASSCDMLNKVRCSEFYSCHNFTH